MPPLRIVRGPWGEPLLFILRIIGNHVLGGMFQCYWVLLQKLICSKNSPYSFAVFVSPLNSENQIIGMKGGVLISLRVMAVILLAIHHGSQSPVNEVKSLCQV